MTAAADEHEHDHELDEAPAPRLCHLIKWPDFDGYGFNLHAERSNPGQFIGKIDDDSPAQLAGLREGDRIIEVNGVNINNENHRQVVERIKANADEARLLVVDPAADLWYREHDLVVKSSQMNVVYRRTPVPRPAPDSPQAKYHNTNNNNTSTNNSSSSQQQQQQDSTTTTSDNKNEQKQQQQQDADTPTSTDSLEQQQQQHREQEQDSIEAPAVPMSPDSGAGADEQLTVEAEINLQTAQVSEADKSRKRRLLDEVKQVQANKMNGEQVVVVVDPQSMSGQTIEPDSLTNDSSPPTTTTTTTIDNNNITKEQARQVHNRSADSGKSSSPDAATRSSSSSDGGSHSSLAAEDSLEEAQQTNLKLMSSSSSSSSSSSQGEVEHATAAAPVELEQKASSVESSVRQATTIEKNHVDNDVEGEKKKEVVDHDDGEDDDHHHDDDQRAQTNLPQLNKSTTDVSGHESLANVKMISGANNSNNATPNNNNNNYSGLNLNMTASQMRELIASRKKFDPKKAAMNLRQKYEIIQQM